MAISILCTYICNYCFMECPCYVSLSRLFRIIHKNYLLWILELLIMSILFKLGVFMWLYLQSPGLNSVVKKKDGTEKNRKKNRKVKRMFLLLDNTISYRLVSSFHFKKYFIIMLFKSCFFYGFVGHLF